MKIQVRNGRTVVVRSLQESDNKSLHHYLQNLSEESRSRFGPHPFDQETINSICQHPNSGLRLYVAVDETISAIVAYMLIQQGMIEADQYRYAQRGHFFDPTTTVTYAPSVADDWQSSGLGTAMVNIIENELKKQNVRTIILWGGVQATNIKALNFYKKQAIKSSLPFGWTIKTIMT